MDIRIIILVVSLFGEFELEKGVIGLFTTHYEYGTSLNGIWSLKGYTGNESFVCQIIRIKHKVFHSLCFPSLG